MNSSPKKVLLLSNLDLELNDPFFRLGAYKTYLISIAKSLKLQDDFDVKFLMNKHIFVALNRDLPGSVSGDDVILSDPIDLEREQLGTFISDSYLGLDLERETRALTYLSTLLANWAPDAIVCWEAPTSLFRKAFPNASVVDLMPSMFARPPYPRAIAIDPVGLYKNCWFSPQNLPTPLESDPTPAQMTEELRYTFAEHFKQLNVRSEFAKLLDIRDGQRVSLVPLQISAYFGFRDNCEFNNQFEFLLKAASSAKGDTVLTTQYVGGFVSERAITAENLKYLQDNIADVRYNNKLEVIDSVSQFMVPWVDCIYSVSSTLGLQAKLFEKRLIAPATSHLRYIADSDNLNGEASAYKHNSDAFMELYLSRGMLLFERVTSNDGYFADVLRDLIDRKQNNASGVDVLPAKTTVGNSTEQYLKYSKLAPSQRTFKKLFPSAGKLNDSLLPATLDSSITSAGVSVVSFDIFDTLVRRTVYKPEDVFMIMQRRLAAEKQEILPEYALLRFAELRQAAERLTRQERDQALLTGRSTTEEITIDEVYRTFASSMGLGVLDIGKLIEMEQEIEISVLRPRKVGKLMYDKAQAAGKRIVITSDFIHDETFIRRVLSACGYYNFEKLFLSSSVGKKKHSGDLFDDVWAQTGVASANHILHIGDNPIGDLQKARDKGFRAAMVPSGRALIKEALLKRKVNEAVLNGSFYLRTIAGLFANTYLHTDQRGTARVDSGNGQFELIENLEEFGFLVVGPIALSFAEWILERAAAHKASQIVFFARDCHLPYLMAKMIRDVRGLHELNLIYAPTSRKSVTGLDLNEPEDILKVRIDDFTGSGTLGRLLAERFLIKEEEVPSSLLAKWGIPSLASEKRQLGIASIYGLVLELARAEWGKLRSRYADRRDNFVQYLEEQSTIDFSAPTVAVDFGYQGSIHRKFGNLFSKPLIPLFFMTYSDGFGGSPIADAEAFYSSSCTAATKGTVALTHNLLLETLMNESVGSAVDLLRIPNGGFEVIRDKSVTGEHTKSIKEIHTGALKLCSEWLQECAPLHRVSEPERDAVMFFFGLIARNPTLTEVNLLKYLVFDNAFAGIQASVLVVSPQNRKQNPKVLWPEAERVLAAADALNRKTAKASSLPIPTPQTLTSVKNTRFASVKKSAVRPFVAKLGNEKDLREFGRDPAVFFASLRQPHYRLIGKILFPQRRG